MLIIWSFELSELCRPDVDDENHRASTHPYRSPVAATVNGRDLTLLTRAQTSDQEYSYLTAGRQHHTPATLHKPYQEEPGRMFSRVRQSMCRRLWHTPKVSQKFAGK